MQKKQGMGGGHARDQWRMVFAALYALAMLLLGFAHQPIARAGGIDLAAFALPDGSIPSLCTSAGDDAGAPTLAGAVWCEACLLVHAGGLLPPPVALPCRPSLHERTSRAQPVLILSGRVAAAQRARGPPVGTNLT